MSFFMLRQPPAPALAGLVGSISATSSLILEIRSPVLREH